MALAKIYTDRIVTDVDLIKELRYANVELAWPFGEFEVNSFEDLYRIAQIFEDHGWTVEIDGDNQRLIARKK